MRRALLCGVFVLTGCAREDGDKLARIGRLTASKLRDVTPARSPFDNLAPDSTPAARVRTRLRTDAALVDLSIDVQQASDGIHLKGQVPSQDHVDLAVKLARETVGVTNVVNELEVGP
jgi:osmotically-inducible protein OsmY